MLVAADRSRACTATRGSAARAPSASSADGAAHAVGSLLCTTSRGGTTRGHWSFSLSLVRDGRAGGSATRGRRSSRMAAGSRTGGPARARTVSASSLHMTTRSHQACSRSRRRAPSPESILATTAPAMRRYGAPGRRSCITAVGSGRMSKRTPLSARRRDRLDGAQRMQRCAADATGGWVEMAGPVVSVMRASSGDGPDARAANWSGEVVCDMFPGPDEAPVGLGPNCPAGANGLYASFERAWRLVPVRAGRS